MNNNIFFKKVVKVSEEKMLRKVNILGFWEFILFFVEFLFVLGGNKFLVVVVFFFRCFFC